MHPTCDSGCRTPVNATLNFRVTRLCRSQTNDGLNAIKLLRDFSAGYLWTCLKGSVKYSSKFKSRPLWGLSNIGNSLYQKFVSHAWFVARSRVPWLNAFLIRIVNLTKPSHAFEIRYPQCYCFMHYKNSKTFNILVNFNT